MFKQTEAIIQSMTPAERRESVDSERQPQAAHRCGQRAATIQEVNRLLKQFEDTRKMMKTVAGGGMKMPKMPGGMMRR